MEKVGELKCPNCDASLHASFELQFSQASNTAKITTVKETAPYVNLLFRIFEEKLDGVEVEEFCKKVDTVLLRKKFEEVIKTLTPKQEKVIKMRFGIGNNGSEQTLEKIGEHFNLTGGRIWQIEDKALKKFRHPSRSRKLRSFLESI